MGLAILCCPFWFITFYLLISFEILNGLASSTNEETLIVEMRIWYRKSGTGNLVPFMLLQDKLIHISALYESIDYVILSRKPYCFVISVVVYTSLCHAYNKTIR